jgi:antitoxin YefM
MAVKTSYSHARANLATLWEEVEDSREATVIERRGHEDMALIPAAELASLRETAYLFRCPANAARLLAALTRARRGRSRSTESCSTLWFTRSHEDAEDGNPFPTRRSPSRSVGAPRLISRPVSPPLASRPRGSQPNS